LGQGRENAKQFLKENDEVRERILSDVYEELGLNSPASGPEAELEGVAQVALGADGHRLEEPADQVF
jgi:hypothetical protein